MPDRPPAERLSFAAGDAASDLRVRALNDARVRPSGEMVLYWMQMYRRASDNAALAYAILRANELGLPCVVYESLRPDYPFASDRFHTFVLESARDVAAGLAARGLRHVFFLPRTRDEAKGVLAKLTARAALVVTDDFPSFIVPAQNAALARHATCPVLVVDDNAIVPLALFPKDEIGARTLRPKLARVLGDWLLPLEEPVPRIAAPDRLDLPFEPLRLGKATSWTDARSITPYRPCPSFPAARRRPRAGPMRSSGGGSASMRRTAMTRRATARAGSRPISTSAC
jgi:deoxyribodipyrimidine photo-lyase